ncbi:MAG: hypothetical protein LBS89_08960 [Zoogloeaceae bacterium]|jgi:hypothetical protein|nr:hypothetical protein [Zoogloeaceae bacterium]
MRALLLFLFCLVLSVTSVATPAAEGGFAAPEEFGQWLVSYYQHPEPERLPEAVRYMAASGLLKNEARKPFLFGFLAGVLHDNPDKAAAWVAALAREESAAQEALIQGLWYADLPDSAPQALALLARHPRLKPGLAWMYRLPAPTPIEQISLEQGSWVLEALWGKFIATGEPQLVRRVMDALLWYSATPPRLIVPQTMHRLRVGDAAYGSLRANARLHPRVLEICQETLKVWREDLLSPTYDRDMQIAAVLAEVLREAQTPPEEEKPAVRAEPSSSEVSSTPPPAGETEPGAADRPDAQEMQETAAPPPNGDAEQETPEEHREQDASL